MDGIIKVITEGNFRTAIALARLGLYETMELVKWEGGDKYYIDIDNDQFCVVYRINEEETKTKMPMSIVRANGLDY